MVAGHAKRRSASSKASPSCAAAGKAVTAKRASAAAADVEMKLQRERQGHESSLIKSTLRLQEAWADIELRHQSYSSDSLQRATGKTRALREEDDDIIDLQTMTLVLDRGVLRNSRPGSFAIGSYALPGGRITRHGEGWDHLESDDSDEDNDDWEELSDEDEDDDPIGQWDGSVDAPSVMSRLEKRKRGEVLVDKRMFLQDEARNLASSASSCTTSLAAPASTSTQRQSNSYAEVLASLRDLPAGTGNMILPLALAGSGTSRSTTPLASFARARTLDVDRRATCEVQDYSESEESEDEDELGLSSAANVEARARTKVLSWRGKERHMSESASTTKKLREVLTNINLSSSCPPPLHFSSSSPAPRSSSPLVSASSRARSVAVPASLPLSKPYPSSPLRASVASTSALRVSQPHKSSPLRQVITPSSLPSPAPSPPLRPCPTPSTYPSSVLTPSTKQAFMPPRRSPRSLANNVSSRSASVTQETRRRRDATSVSLEVVASHVKRKGKGKERVESVQVIVISDSEEEREERRTTIPAVLPSRSQLKDPPIRQPSALHALDRLPAIGSSSSRTACTAEQFSALSKSTSSRPNSFPPPSSPIPRSSSSPASILTAYVPRSSSSSSPSVPSASSSISSAFHRSRLLASTKPAVSSPLARSMLPSALTASRKRHRSSAASDDDEAEYLPSDPEDESGLATMSVSGLRTPPDSREELLSKSKMVSLDIALVEIPRQEAEEIIVAIAPKSTHLLLQRTLDRSPASKKLRRSCVGSTSLFDLAAYTAAHSAPRERSATPQPQPRPRRSQSELPSSLLQRKTGRRSTPFSSRLSPFKTMILDSPPSLVEEADDEDDDELLLTPRSRYQAAAPRREELPKMRGNRRASSHMPTGLGNVGMYTVDERRRHSSVVSVSRR